ncbi:MAG: DUF1902 domain-containing protein [Magnetococcales bacterium]|nr:DUF1902 domain-containing protein [Magnetococcales bacterium]
MSRKRKHRSSGAFKIRAVWDSEANVWYVEDSDIPGLVTEAATMEDLSARIESMIPDLLRMNDQESFA